ncbi:MAG: adenylate/guanylate cyclase domain-containing protein [Burkholderiales bacterium]|nr:adenylate/guanylate cyclase domain-containing protein [Opitutaceae bacterium]
MSLLNEFYAQLDVCNAAAPADEPAHEAAIWERFGIERTVLVLDMAGFSVKVQKHGLMYFLRKIRYMQSVVAPLLRHHHGELVKFEADNAYAVFPRAADAIACALDTHAAFSSLADGSPDVDHLDVSIGLARGRILLIPGHDFFGDAVNLASKLGEDVADASETWIAADLFADALAMPGVAVEPTTLTLSGIEIQAGQIRRTKA